MYIDRERERDIEREADRDREMDICFPFCSVSSVSFRSVLYYVINHI